MSSPVCGARGLVVAGWHKPAKGYSARRTASFLQRTLDEAVVRGELTPCDTTRLARAVQATVGGSLMQWASIETAIFATASEKISTRCCSRAIRHHRRAVNASAGRRRE
jgi:hypothetical protein